VGKAAFSTVCKIFTHGKKILLNQGLCCATTSLLTILSTEYGENCGLEIRPVPAVHCDFFTHGKFILMDQRLEAVCGALLTILSTELVQNPGGSTVDNSLAWLLKI
jgi:hypothetical protein